MSSAAHAISKKTVGVTEMKEDDKLVSGTAVLRWLAPLSYVRSVSNLTLDCNDALVACTSAL